MLGAALGGGRSPNGSICKFLCASKNAPKAEQFTTGAEMADKRRAESVAAASAPSPAKKPAQRVLSWRTLITVVVIIAAVYLRAHFARKSRDSSRQHRKSGLSEGEHAADPMDLPIFSQTMRGNFVHKSLFHEHNFRKLKSNAVIKSCFFI